MQINEYTKAMRNWKISAKALLKRLLKLTTCLNSKLKEKIFQCGLQDLILVLMRPKIKLTKMYFINDKHTTYYAVILIWFEQKCTL